MKVNSDQTIFDLLLQGAGSINEISIFIDENSISDFDALPTEVSFNNLNKEAIILAAYAENNITIASQIIEDETTLIPQAIGAASIGSTFIIN